MKKRKETKYIGKDKKEKKSIEVWEYKSKEEKNKLFLSRLKNDIYIDESVKVLNNMISQANLALNNSTTEPSKKN